MLRPTLQDLMDRMPGPEIVEPFAAAGGAAATPAR